jgi:iron complex transport system substrate-binding protein
MKLCRFIFRLSFLFVGWILTLPMSSAGAEFPMVVKDSYQNKLHIQRKPQQVVCLAPYITEMLLAFGQDQVLVGLTRQDLTFNRALRKKNVGSYFCPDIQAVADCHPDLIIAAPSHKEVIHHFGSSSSILMIMEARKVEEAFCQMEMIGRLFDCETEAAATLKHNRDQLALVKAKLDAIPIKNRKRVARVIAGDELACPGDDSFQNEMIAAAGGIPPKWGKTGFAVTVNLQEWQYFNPQVIYGCHRDEKPVQVLLNREGWKDVDAVQNGFVTMFPYDLICQVSTRVGDFVQWLAAVLYLDTFAGPEKAVLDDAALEQNPIALDLAYVEQAEVVKHRVADAEYKSLVIRFKRPQDVLSTLEGNRSGVRGVGNTYVPMHASLGHMVFGVEQAQKAIANNLGYTVDKFAGLMTGADMDNLSVQKRTYKDLEVTALVTAGVRGNALRMSKDSGGYNKPGTINIVVLTNRRLSPNAMAWAVVTVTEAKSAALLDLDIRSTYTPWDHRATGTGTDTVIVVQGEGPAARYAGGHTKIGELIAKAVHAGVTEAISRQNGIKADRDLFQRLAERKLYLEQIAEYYPVKIDKKILVSRLEGLLMTPCYASFIESALAISDDYRKGLIKELTFFDDMCCSMAVRLSGRSDLTLENIPSTGSLPVVMDRAFGALVAGVMEKNK